MKGWVLTLCLCLSTLPAGAQTDPTITAARASAMLALASTRMAEAAGARDRVEALTETIRAFEEGLAAIREALRRSEAREQAILSRLETERDRLASLLAAAAAIERAPAPLLLLHPNGPEAAARTGMIVSDVTPAIAAQTNALRARVQELAAQRSLQAQANADVQAALEDMQTARADLSEAIADRVDLPPRVATDPAAMRQLLAATSSLEALTLALMDQPIGPLPDALSIAQARGGLDLPVFGQLLRGYQEPDAAGVARPGMILATRPNALVTTPWRGTIRYAGPMPNQGLVVILETDPDHMMILSGLGTAYVSTGQIVETGAALGLMDQPRGPDTQIAAGVATEAVSGANMGASSAPTSENLITPGSEVSGLTLSQTLYIELRVNTDPVDPAPWFAVTGR